MAWDWVCMMAVVSRLAFSEFQAIFNVYNKDSKGSHDCQAPCELL